MPGISNSEMINKIEISGNDIISESTIIVFGDIKKDRSYAQEDLNNIIKNLYETNFFSKIDVNLQDGVLKIVVKENPIIDSMQLKGVKAEKFKKKILENLTNKEKSSFQKNYVTRDVNAIEQFYRNLGYYFVEVEAEVQELANNRINLIYFVDEGKRAKIAKIFFLGDKKIRDKKLRSIITSEETRFWKFISNTKYLNQDRVELDKRLLRNYYRNKGYYEARVTSSNAEYIENKGFVLTYSIDAGKRYKFKKVYINVADNLEKSSFFSLNKELKKLVGNYYSPRKVKKVLDKIDKLSQQKELQFINHQLFETLEDDMIEIKIDIFEGRKFFVERIDIVGNYVTNDSVIRSEMIVDEGDPYSALLLNKSVNNLKARGIFKSVTQNVLPGSADDLNVIQIEIEEKPTGEISAGAGVGTSGGSFGFAVKENNFMGTGVKLDTSLEIDEESIRAKFATNNPNFRYTGNSLSTTMETTKTDRLSNSGFESTRTGFSLGTSFEQYEDFYINASTSLYYEDISTSSTASSILKKMEGNYTSFNLRYSLTEDKRNQAWQPSEGYIGTFIQKLPIYADSPSLMNGFDISVYKTLSEDIIGSVKFYSRTINSINDEDVKITERLHLPSRRLRGFKKGGIGPVDSSDHIGGNYAAALGFNVFLPNLLPEDTKTDINLFFDAANLWGVDYNDTLGTSATIRTAVGVNANMYTVIGPLNLSFSQHITKASTDETEGFRFSLGTTF